jgi:3-hydroxymyristoyl/3-hydroxydecanoyl-(acyl carrier protein) dehydratase
MEISQIDIKTILPQQPPFVMVDRLLQCDMVVTRTQFSVRADNLFCKDGI